MLQKILLPKYFPTREREEGIPLPRLNYYENSGFFFFQTSYRIEESAAVGKTHGHLWISISYLIEQYGAES